MADHRALLVLAEELEDALGDVDTRVLAEQPIGEGGRVAVGDEADARRLETVLVGDLMDQLMHAGITPLGLRILQEFLPLSQRSVKSDSHGLISQISRLRTTVSTMASIRLTSTMNSMAASTQHHHSRPDAEGDEGSEQQLRHAILFTARMEGQDSRDTAY